MRLAWLIVVLALAGCAAPAPDPAHPSAAGPGPQALAPAPATFPGAAPLDKTLWLNGTLRPTQASGVADPAPRLPATAEPGDLVLDVSSDVPRGVPVHVSLDVRAEVGRGDVDAWIEAPRAAFRTRSAFSPFGGTVRQELVIVHDGSGPVRAHVFYDVAGEPPEAPFTMSVRLRAAPDLVPGGAAVGLTFAGNASNLTVDLHREKREQMFEPKEARLMAWDPQDVFLGSFPLADDGPTTIPLPPTPGEYALLLSQGGRDARILTEGNATLRSLWHEFAVGDVRAGTAQGAEWTDDYARVPILVGMQFSGSTASMDVRATLEGPEGPMLDEAFTGGPWLSAQLPDGTGVQSFFGFDSGFGVAGLVPGSYHAKAAFSQSAGADPVMAQGYAAFVARKAP